MNIKFKLLFLLLLCPLASAYTIQYNIENSVSGLPVVGANVSLINESFILSNVSDAAGDSFLSSNTNAYFTVLISRSGYSNYNSNVLGVNDSYHAIQMIPLSTEGIIKLRVNDLTLMEHTFCLYWSDPPRLYKCVGENDTYFTISNNVNYTLVPDIELTDLVSSPSNFSNNFYIIVPILIGCFIFACFIILLIGVLVFLYRKMKGGK